VALRAASYIILFCGGLIDMRFFLDSANLEEIRKGVYWGVLAGVTTNPSLVSKEEGISFHQRIQEIAELVKGPVSAEVIGLERDTMIAEARELAALHPQVVVKIPMTSEGMGAVRVLSEENIHTNVTLVFSPQQALLAAAAGATYVSPFVGRLDDIGEQGIGLVGDVAHIFALHDIPTQIIAASIRHPHHVFEAAQAGAHIATVPFGVLKKMFSHPLTDAGIERFLKDWEGVSTPRGKNS